MAACGLCQRSLPEFEQLTGIKVHYDTPGFLIYNQRVDLELSTRGSSYDVDLPGGTLTVEWTVEDRILLTGPAVLVAEGYWFARC